MLNNSDISFLADVLSKMRINVSVINNSSPVETALSKSVEIALGIFKSAGCTLSEYLGNVESNILYKLVEQLDVCYFVLLPPCLKANQILLIGPFREAEIGDSEIIELLESYSVDPKHKKLFSTYLKTLPVFTKDNPLNTLIDAFCDRAFGDCGYTVEQIMRDKGASVSVEVTDSIHLSGDVIAGMRLMEERYANENELMRLVASGQTAKIDALLTSVSGAYIEERVHDRLRNFKNYCIILNTLLRKAAEKGGVHPLNIDNISSDFAVKIEQCVSQDRCMSLMREMFRSYTRLVNKRSVNGMSPIVQRAIFLIESELSGDLSLSRLAGATNVSPGYFSSLFKKETGKTVTDYVTDKRIAHAVYLLDSTHLQVQTVAAHCGIVDLQYFSKIFKKRVGITPREYRIKNKK